MRARRHPGPTAGEGSGRRITNRSGPRGNSESVDVQRYATHTGIKHHPRQTGLNDTERLVYRVLDDEFVTAREIAGFAGISVEQCRRALATLRTLGMAELERPRRRNATNVWRRA